MNLINEVYLENCMDTMSRMDDKCVDVVFTSPPYNRKRNDKYQHFTDINNDYYAMLSACVRECMRVCKGNVFFNLQKNYYNKIDIFSLLGEFAQEICEVFVWAKTNPMPASGFNVTNSYEFIICFGFEIKSNKTYTKNLLTTSVNRMTKGHKAIMHPAVADFFISNFTAPGDIVYDPFMGTGTTAVSALRLGRKFLGSEISAPYWFACNENLNRELCNNNKNGEPENEK